MDFLTTKGAHVLVLGTLTGMTIHTSFVTGIIQFKALPRLMFGNLQSKQFPIYFAISSLGSLYLTYSTARIGGIPIAEAFSKLRTNDDALQVVLMGASAVGAFLNWFIIGPKSTRVMFERHRLEKAGEPVPSAMNKQFGRLHGISSLLNLGLVLTCISHSLWVGKKWQ
ncbi:hypothetical protein DFJ73DRAFT_849593 [Zopfochytrium polystomum]|nr:hypothetical protein DFJ73DRAFT_849593 [Zopfochytrium polystomum]